MGSHREPQRGAVRHGSADHEAPCRPRTAQGTARGHAGPAGGRLPAHPGPAGGRLPAHAGERERR
ncbi:hypothetical protein CYL17_05475 [Thermobispora bispora]|nr:hypothetical protein [Actinomycetales bacterium]QSI47372.1 hypothetical protein CYL17_05475 [Thermobispora bispora]